MKYTTLPRFPSPIKKLSGFMSLKERKATNIPHKLMIKCMTVIRNRNKCKYQQMSESKRCLFISSHCGLDQICLCLKEHWNNIYYMSSSSILGTKTNRRKREFACDRSQELGNQLHSFRAHQLAADQPQSDFCPGMNFLVEALKRSPPQKSKISI